MLVAFRAGLLTCSLQVVVEMKTLASCIVMYIVLHRVVVSRGIPTLALFAYKLHHESLVGLGPFENIGSSRRRLAVIPITAAFILGIDTHLLATIPLVPVERGSVAFGIAISITRVSFWTILVLLCSNTGYSKYKKHVSHQYIEEDRVKE